MHAPYPSLEIGHWNQNCICCWFAGAIQQLYQLKKKWFNFLRGNMYGRCGSSSMISSTSSSSLLPFPECDWFHHVWQVWVVVNDRYHRSSLCMHFRPYMKIDLTNLFTLSRQQLPLFCNFLSLFHSFMVQCFQTVTSISQAFLCAFYHWTRSTRLIERKTRRLNKEREIEQHQMIEWLGEAMPKLQGTIYLYSRHSSGTAFTSSHHKKQQCVLIDTPLYLPKRLLML